MQSLWDDREAARYISDLAQRVYTSRLLGRDPLLVLHGGGNTSVKIRERNILGEEEDILYVKGSGWDLATIEEAGFSPVRMARLLGLARLDNLSDVQMAAELKSNMTNASAPAPSVEAILHAILPHRFVDHTHADALISICNTPDGEKRVREAFGDDVIVVPYVMPGFKLARLCTEIVPREMGPKTAGIILMSHGLFSFGETARESYERMIELVSRAERYLQTRGAWDVPVLESVEEPRPDRVAVAALRCDIAAALGAPEIMASYRDPQVMSFLWRDDLAVLSQQGPATPDHVIRTKRLPMLGTDVSAYVEAYGRYVAENESRTEEAITPLDPAPRIILDPSLGMITVGRTVADAAIAEDLYRHTMTIVSRAAALGGYRALPAGDIFDVEYWSLEQAKLKKGGLTPPLTGEVALVTGAASGIGKATVEAMLEAGAAVIALDILSSVTQIFDRQEVLPLPCDVADEEALDRALDAAVERFGGLDMLTLNAGIFPSSRPVEDLSHAEWDRVMRVNLDANLSLLRMAYPLLRRSPRGGRVVVVGSKNVPAPGPGAAAYSASKAALTQLARVTALEWGKDGIRVNVLHPNAVFDTGIWTEDVLASRARQYGMSVEEYRRNNVLGVGVTSRDVADLAVALCTPLFARTTGAQIPVDGGNDRVI